MPASEPNERINAALAGLHDVVAARHDLQRRRLLAALPTAAPSDRRAGRRFAAGGLALTAALLAAFWLSGGASPSNAMERMAAALDRVACYRFRMESAYVTTRGGGRTVRQVTTGTQRLDPPGLHARTHIVETLGADNDAPGPPKVLVDLEEMHRDPGDGQGIVIDHLKRRYWRVDGGITAESDGDIQKVIYMVRERYGRVTQSLGERVIDGQRAVGFEFVLEHDHPVSELGPAAPPAGGDDDAPWPWLGQAFRVWVDPESDLPIEFQSARRGDDFETTSRFTDLEWNVPVDPGEFTPTAPAGYKQLDGPPPVE